MESVTLFKEVGKPIQKIKINLEDLDQVKDIVGYFLDVVPLHEDIKIIINEDAEEVGLKENFKFGDSSILGNALFCSFNGDEPCGLDEGQEQFILNIFNE